jgi:hypothetical protein
MAKIRDADIYPTEKKNIENGKIARDISIDFIAFIIH